MARLARLAIFWSAAIEDWTFLAAGWDIERFLTHVDDGGSLSAIVLCNPGWTTLQLRGQPGYQDFGGVGSNWWGGGG